jgi:hypothetical protein
VYRPRLPREKAVSIMHEGRGSHFDPVVLDPSWPERSSAWRSIRTEALSVRVLVADDHPVYRAAWSG